MRRPRSFALRLSLFALLLAAAGCNTYEITQTSHFADDNGAILRVDYGRAERDNVNTFRSPVNGREMEFRSRLVVEVTLPPWPKGLDYPGRKEGREPPFDGESFTAWQCMNFAGNGTMYRTDDEEWYFLASGFTCKVARRDARFTSGYRDVYGGVLFNTPVKTPEKDTRWRKVKTRDRKYVAE